MSENLKVLKFEKIIISGGNGFTGRYLCKYLISRGLKFSVILRPGTNADWMVQNKIPIIYFDLYQISENLKVLKNFDCFINIASIGFGLCKHIIEACEMVSIQRVIFISSTSIFTSLNASSKEIRTEAENLIMKSNLIWTIIRPTMIYGSPRDRNMIRLIRWIDHFPILPIFGSGNALQQPINVEDLVSFIYRTIKKKEAFNNVFNVSGKEPITFNQIIKIISKVLKRKPLKIYLPSSITSQILFFLELLNIKLPIKSEQIKRLNEDKSFSHKKAKTLIGYDPINFHEGIKREIFMYKNQKEEY
tara:strand:- start:188 stop:1099 length:912 start_codon:yes stop_codon:yes gene_type:complete